jgi:Toprim-like
MTTVRVDRDDVLARTDLPAMLDSLSGPALRAGPGARWRCPDPGHPDESPSVSVFTDHRGVQRWRCWSGGHGGTAIDALVAARSMTVGEALEQLASLAGGWVASPARLPPSPRRPVPLSLAVVRYVEGCEKILWTQTGWPVLDWLTEARGLDPDVLRLNRVGADPGPELLRRPPGLPRGGVGAVFPALDEQGSVAYCQTRYLDPSEGRSKYDNPAARFGDNPRVGIVRPAKLAATDSLYVCEGLPDAYTAATAGFDAVAVLGATYPDERMARRITALVAGRSVVIAFDNDAAGNVGAERLGRLLASHHVGTGRAIFPEDCDLNTWVRAHSGTSIGAVDGAAVLREVPLPTVM